MPVNISNKTQSNVITHSTIHGHIHTYDGEHRHIHGHIHKHQHVLPPNIDATVLMQAGNAKSPASPTEADKTNDTYLPGYHNPAVLPSPSSTIASNSSNNLANQQEIIDEPSLDLTHCQIQQIIDECCHNTLDNCFNCEESEVDNDQILFSGRETCEECVSDDECCDNEQCIDLVAQNSDVYKNVQQPKPSSTFNYYSTEESPFEIKNQLQTLFDYEQHCFEPDCIGNDAVLQKDKCFEICDFDSFNKDTKQENDHQPLEATADIPESYKLPSTLSTSSKLSDLRTESIKGPSINKNHKHIHAHDVLHHCFNETDSQGNPNKKRRTSAKVEPFHFNWINLNDTSLEIPKAKSHSRIEAAKQKDHLHCLWSNCNSTTAQYSSNKELQSHVLKDHIMGNELNTPDYDQGDHFEFDPSILKDKSFYACEWLDCDFKSDDVMQLLNHIPSDHGFKQNFPDIASGVKIADVDEEARLNTEKTNRHHHHHHHHYHHAHHHHSQAKSHNGSTEEDDVDPAHTCKWENEEGVSCDKTFDSTQDLTDHLIDDHIGGGQSKYVCNWENCSRNHKEFNQRQKIIRHLHVHTKHRPCVCKICGKKFSIDLMLEQHMRIHTGEKPFQCSICAKWFKTSSSLSIHVRVHSGEKPLLCKYPGCNKRFNESSNLTKHYKIHQRALKCNCCIKTLNSEKQLMNHLKLYHGVTNDEAYQKLKLQHNGFKNPHYVEVSDGTKTSEASEGSDFD